MKNQVKDCPQPESPWKPIVVGAPWWSAKRKWEAPIQLELFSLQMEFAPFRAGMPRGTLVTHLAVHAASNL